MAAGRELVPFSTLCATLDQLADPFKTPKLRTAVLRDFLQQTLKPASSEEMFAIARLLAPSADSQRGNYGLKETQLARALSEVCVLPKKDADILKHFRDPAYLEGLAGARAGDFSSVAVAVCRSRLPGRGGKVTVADVNLFLDECIALQSRGSERNAAFATFIRKLSWNELKWLIRIILKDLKAGVSPQRLLGLIDTRAPELFLTCSDLRKTFQLLEETPSVESSESSAVDVSKKKARLFHTFKPMLAQRLEPRGIRNFFQEAANSGFLVEPKYDGERILTHYNGDTVEFYTRKGNRYSDMYGPALSPHVKAVVQGFGCILDGEVMAKNFRTNEFEPFGRNRSVAAGAATGELKLCYVIFDIIGYCASQGGEWHDLTATPLKDRRRLLQKVIEDGNQRVWVTQSEMTTSADEVEVALSQVQREKKEGLMLKHPLSLYVFNARNAGWWKLKPPLGALADTLDLLVIGGYFGDSSGRRVQTTSDWIHHVTVFLCALKDGEEKAKSFCKVGTGYTLAELRDMRNWLVRKSLRYTGPHCVDYLNPSFRFGPGERPDIVVKTLADGFVMEVQAAEIVPSISFEAQWTLRFPRAVKPMRTDKDWTDAMTMAEFLEFISDRHDDAKDAVNVGIKLKKETAGSDVDEEPAVDEAAGASYLTALLQSTAKSTSARNTKSPLTLLGGRGDRPVEVKGTIFVGLSLLLVGKTFGDQSLDAFERTIRAYGGTIVAHVQQLVESGGGFVVTAQDDFRCKQLSEKYDVPVVHYTFFYDCIVAGHLLDLSPVYLFHSNKAVAAQLAEHFDALGDAYFEPATTDSLVKIISLRRHDHSKNGPAVANGTQERTSSYPKQKPGFIYVRGDAVVAENFLSQSESDKRNKGMENDLKISGISPSFRLRDRKELRRAMQTSLDKEMKKRGLCVENPSNKVEETYELSMEKVFEQREANEEYWAEVKRRRLDALWPCSHLSPRYIRSMVDLMRGLTSLSEATKDSVDAISRLRH